MELPIIRCSAFVVAPLFNVGLALSQTAGTKAANPSQAAGAAHLQAMEECKARYGGGLGRGWLARDRYIFIEACFKELTGKYPFQANVKCLYRLRGREFYC